MVPPGRWETHDSTNCAPGFGCHCRAPRRYAHAALGMRALPDSTAAETPDPVPKNHPSDPPVADLTTAPSDHRLEGLVADYRSDCAVVRAVAGWLAQSVHCSRPAAVMAQRQSLSDQATHCGLPHH